MSAGALSASHRVKSDLSIYEWSVLQAICYAYRDADERCDQSYAELAKHALCHRSTAIRACQSLEAIGLIEIDRRQHIYGGPDTNAISLAFWSREQAEEWYAQDRPARRREQRAANLDIGIGGRQRELDPSSSVRPPPSSSVRPPLVAACDHPSSSERPPSIEEKEDEKRLGKEDAVKTFARLAPAKVWNHAQLGLAQLVNGANYDTFLKDTWGVRFDGLTFTIGCPNPFIREALETRFTSLLRKALSDVLGAAPDIAVVVDAQRRAS